MKRRKPLPGGSAIPGAPKAMAAKRSPPRRPLEGLQERKPPAGALDQPDGKKAFASRRFFFFALPHLINPLDLRFQPESLGPVEELLVSSNDSCGSRN